MMISSMTRLRPIGETCPEAHDEEVRKIDWAALWRRAEKAKFREKKK